VAALAFSENTFSGFRILSAGLLRKKRASQTEQAEYKGSRSWHGLLRSSCTSSLGAGLREYKPDLPCAHDRVPDLTLREVPSRYAHSSAGAFE
jgi:hypothetical protein